MVGAVIGSYQLVRKLGEGGMGAVYLGQHTLLGRRAAIKVLLPALSARPDIVERFFNEARAVTTISDPGIVQVFDFGYHTDGSAFIVMEFLEGEPLDRRLGRLSRLAVPEALRLCRQLATSLAAAHAQRIVHRDLKPENIFLVHDAAVASGERCKILDFGIAKLSDEQPGRHKTSLGTLMGTPVYMSPEQCRGLADIDHRSDIYALGCVLFHLITGRPPFEGEGTGDIISAHIREPAPAPSSRAIGIAPDLDAFVLRCLAKAPADRYQSMAALAAEIGALLARRDGEVADTAPAFHLLPTTKLSRSDILGLLPSAHQHPSQPGPHLTPAQAISAHPTPAGRYPTPAGGHPAPGPLASRESTYVTPPPMRAGAHAIGATTLGSGAGQQTHHIARPARVGRWIAAGLVVGALALGGGLLSARRPAPGLIAAKPVSVEPPVVRPPPPKPLLATQDAGLAVQPSAELPDAGLAAQPGVAPPSDAAVERDASASDVARTPTKKPARSRDHARGAAPAGSPSVTGGPAAHGAAKDAIKPTLASGSCGRSAFAAVYDATAPTKDTVGQALRNLRACHDAGAITDVDFDRYQIALVGKL